MSRGMLQPVAVCTKKFALLEFINKCLSISRPPKVSNRSNFFIFRQVMTIELHCLALEPTPFADISTEKILNGFLIDK